MVIYLLHDFISYIPLTIGSCNREKIEGYFVLYLQHVYEILDVFKGTENSKKEN